MSTSSWVVQEALVRVGDYLDQHKADPKHGTLRDPQIKVLEDLCHHFAQGHSRGYIKLPMGSGKSVIFIEVAKAIGLPALVVVPTRLLVDQTVKKFQEFAPDLSVGRLYQKSRKRGQHVAVTTYASLVRGLHHGTLDPQQFYLLVLDEAHQCLSEKRQAAVEEFSHALVLGFTATPRYSEEKQVAHLLHQEIHRMSIVEAVEMGTLAPFRVVIAETELDLRDVRVTVSGDYDRRDLERAVNIQGRNLAAVQLYQLLADQRRALVYCVSVAHARAVADLFNDQGIPAATVSGQLVGQGAREAILRPFREGSIKVVCNAKLLVEGFDDPGVEVCINLRPTASRVLAEQRGGRTLRLDPAKPHKVALIIDVIDQKARRGSPPISFAEVAGTAQALPVSKSRIGQGASGPIWDPPEVAVHGLKIYLHHEEVMRVVARFQEETMAAPDGWLQATELIHVVGRKFYAIYRFMETQKQLHPDQVRHYVGQNGRFAEHIAPELVELAKKELTGSDLPPKGWMLLKTMAERLGVSRNTASKWAQELLADHLEQESECGLFEDTFGRPFTHYSPRFVEELMVTYGRAGNPRAAPRGWRTAKGWETHYNIPRVTLLRLMDSYVATSSEAESLRGEYLSHTNHPRMHYSPELASMAVAFRKSRVAAPDGWASAQDWGTRLGLAYTTFKHTIESLLVARPEDATLVAQAANRNNQLMNFYAPELAAKVAQQYGISVEELSQADDGLRVKPRPIYRRK